MVDFGYAFNKEDRTWLRANAIKLTRMTSVGDLPEIVDPRESELARLGWLQVEDQANQGSCQGQALTECGEFCFTIATGKVLQLSRQYAYIGSQIEDGINGDSGSTLSGGTRLAKKGICSEKVGPYSRSYPGRGYITEAMRKDAENYKLKTHIEITSADHAKQFLGSGIGIIQIGIKWWDFMQNPPGGLVTRFAPPARGFGGHSVVIAGYVPKTRSGQTSPDGYWFLLKNSHSKRYADEGYSYVSPTALNQMIADRSFSVFYGRSDMGTPMPRKLPHSFTKPGGGLRV
jgi:hypothetical protein